MKNFLVVMIPEDDNNSHELTISKKAMFSTWEEAWDYLSVWVLHQNGEHPNEPRKKEAVSVFAYPYHIQLWVVNIPDIIND